ncbi:hypothetical protein RRG08_066974 [Elysia crispata]|uniref:Uncharacterized protein n=1 Tax=Elysia crispata TaxID=231223 RepID=A0AAE0ZAP0_9GAST|nr:hypothetical protein RRG08_066974 [Elysia crispata]
MSDLTILKAPQFCQPHALSAEPPGGLSFINWSLDLCKSEVILSQRVKTGSKEELGTQRNLHGLSTHHMLKSCRFVIIEMLRIPQLFLPQSCSLAGLYVHTAPSASSPVRIQPHIKISHRKTWEAQYANCRLFLGHKIPTTHAGLYL